MRLSVFIVGAPESKGVLIPVPSVVCAPVALWYRFLYGLDQLDFNLRFHMLMLLNP